MVAIFVWRNKNNKTVKLWEKSSQFSTFWLDFMIEKTVAFTVSLTWKVFFFNQKSQELLFISLALIV